MKTLRRFFNPSSSSRTNGNGLHVTSTYTTDKEKWEDEAIKMACDVMEKETEERINYRKQYNELNDKYVESFKKYCALIDKQEKIFRESTSMNKAVLLLTQKAVTERKIPEKSIILEHQTNMTYLQNTLFPEWKNLNDEFTRTTNVLEVRYKKLEDFYNRSTSSVKISQKEYMEERKKEVLDAKATDFVDDYNSAVKACENLSSRLERLLPHCGKTL